MTDAATTHDVAVIGSGAAGLMAACVAAERAGVVIVTDRGLGTSNSAVAQGGLQYPPDDIDAIARFRADILASAGPAVDHLRLDRFVAEVRPTIDLLRRWGLELDRGDDGELVRRLAGGLSEPRVVTAGDRIGTAVLRVLRHRVDELDIAVMTQTRVADLLPDESGIELRLDDGATMRATAVVVAVGGGTYERAAAGGEATSNPANRNTVLHETLRRLGIPEIDPDLFQYQPYGVVHPERGITGKCVPESVVELGARVVTADGEPVAPPTADRRELTAAMFAALESGAAAHSPAGTPALRLTVGAIDRGVLLARYPHLERLYDDASVADGDLLVRPVLHYQLGGFAVQPDGATAHPGLYLAGELTGGLHGRNRLMGNGITQALVDGYLAGRAAAAFSRAGR